MPNLQKLLRRRPEPVEEDPEADARFRRRLASLTEARTRRKVGGTVAEPDAETGDEQDGLQPDEGLEPPPVDDGTLFIHVDPAAAPTEGSPEGVDLEDADTAMVESVDEAAAADVDVADGLPSSRTVAIQPWSPNESWDIPSQDSSQSHTPGTTAEATEAEPAADGDVAPSPTQAPAQARAKPPRPRRSTGGPVRVTALRVSAHRAAANPDIPTCPYCAAPLQPVPVASGRCARCRQRIVVRRVGKRAVYLTEAALSVFTAERSRAANAGRWTRDRDRWLELAKIGGAAPARMARLIRAKLTDEVVEAARVLATTSMERAIRSARANRRWEAASRLRFEEAASLYRIAGSPKPVPEHIVALHRDGLASSLREIAEIAKSAELRGGTCCETCRADDGHRVRISAELREPSLPHAACPRGLCRCRWNLGAADRTIVSGLLRRQARPTRSRADSGGGETSS